MRQRAKTIRCVVMTTVYQPIEIVVHDGGVQAAQCQIIEDLARSPAVLGQSSGGKNYSYSLCRAEKIEVRFVSTAYCAARAALAAGDKKPGGGG